MAINEIQIDVPPERVFAVLRDWRSYGHWVVGSRYVRTADPGFPSAGTKFYPVLGTGPISLSGETEVLEVEPPRRIVLHAKALPLITLINELVLEARNGGTRVRFREDPGDTLSAFLVNPLTHLLIRGRNVESLRRLKHLAEERPDLGREADGGSP